MVITDASNRDAEMSDGGDPTPAFNSISTNRSSRQRSVTNSIFLRLCKAVPTAKDSRYQHLGNFLTDTTRLREKSRLYRISLKFHLDFNTCLALSLETRSPPLSHSYFFLVVCFCFVLYLTPEFMCRPCLCFQSAFKINLLGSNLNVCTPAV